MTDSQHGRLIVLCGPAGVGKGTVLGRVREQPKRAITQTFTDCLHFF